MRIQQQAQEHIIGFYKSLDYSLIQNLIREPHRMGLIGSGRHFRSYLTKINGFPLVVSISRSSFCGGLEARLSTWLKAMEVLRQLPHPLIPPMELIQVKEDQVAYLKPYCPQAAPKDQWLPLMGSLLAMMEERRLSYQDHWQVRLCYQQPYIIDWSDLCFT